MLQSLVCESILWLSAWSLAVCVWIDEGKTSVGGMSGGSVWHVSQHPASLTHKITKQKIPPPSRPTLSKKSNWGVGEWETFFGPSEARSDLYKLNCPCSVRYHIFNWLTKRLSLLGAFVLLHTFFIIGLFPRFPKFSVLEHTFIYLHIGYFWRYFWPLSLFTFF